MLLELFGGEGVQLQLSGLIECILAVTVSLLLQKKEQENYSNCVLKSRELSSALLLTRSGQSPAVPSNPQPPPSQENAPKSSTTTRPLLLPTDNANGR